MGDVDSGEPGSWDNWAMVAAENMKNPEKDPKTDIPKKGPMTPAGHPENSGENEKRDGEKSKEKDDNSRKGTDGTEKKSEMDVDSEPPGSWDSWAKTAAENMTTP